MFHKSQLSRGLIDNLTLIEQKNFKFQEIEKGEALVIKDTTIKKSNHKKSVLIGCYTIESDKQPDWLINN